MLERVAPKVADWIVGSKGAQNVFNSISENASKVSVGVSNGVNFVARPITIMATTKSKNILDGAYCASSSIASGISETLTGVSILKPINKAISKSADELQSSGFFQSIGSKVGVSGDVAKGSFKSALGRMVLIALVPINGLFKGYIHPGLAHLTKSATEKIRGGKLDVHI